MIVSEIVSESDIADMFLLSECDELYIHDITCLWMARILTLLLERWYIIIPICVGLSVTLFAGKELNSVIPSDWNATTWRESIDEVNESLHMSSRVHQIVFLMTLHLLQVLMLFPMMHVTKILYGFWLGPLWGWLLCCVWELVLIGGYLVRIKISPVREVVDIVSEARVRGVLWGELVLLALSHTPLQVDACLLEFGGVTVTEFWTANVLVTCVMTFKNTICGHLLASSFSVTNFAVITTIITLSTLIPTIATVYVSSKTIYKCVEIYRFKADSDEHTDELLEHKAVIV